MPVANIHVLAGHPRPVLKQLLREVSAAFSLALQAPPERLQVWITEIDPGLYAVAGEPADEVLQRQPRSETENPFIRMTLMEGRSLASMQQVIADLTSITARLLGGDPQRIRVQIDLAHPDRWGIGGVPASIIRADELAKRATQAAVTA